MVDHYFYLLILYKLHNYPTNAHSFYKKLQIHYCDYTCVFFEMFWPLLKAMEISIFLSDQNQFLNYLNQDYD